MSIYKVKGCLNSPLNENPRFFACKHYLCLESFYSPWEQCTTNLPGRHPKRYIHILAKQVPIYAIKFHVIKLMFVLLFQTTCAMESKVGLNWGEYASQIQIYIF